MYTLYIIHSLYSSIFSLYVTNLGENFMGCWKGYVLFSVLKKTIKYQEVSISGTS